MVSDSCYSIISQCGLALAKCPRRVSRPFESSINSGRWLAKGPLWVAEIRIANGLARMNASAIARSSTRLNSGMYIQLLDADAGRERPPPHLSFHLWLLRHDC